MPSPPRRPAPPPQEAFTADFSEGLETGLYLALLELVDEGLIITGDEVIIEANSAACRLLEREYRQIAGQPLSTLFPNEQAFLSARERLLIQGEMRGSIRVALPGDRHRELRFIAAARLRPGIHALILSPDLITASGQAPRGETGTDRLWPQLAAALAQGLIVVDSAGRVQALNAAAAQLPGIDRLDIRGLALDTVFPLQWPEAHEVQITRLGPHRARILPGPHPGWRLLLIESVTSSTGLATAATDSPAPCNDLQPDSLTVALWPIVDVRNGRWMGASARLEATPSTHDGFDLPAGQDDVRTAPFTAAFDQHLLQTACKTLASLPAKLRRVCPIVLHPGDTGNPRFAQDLRATLNASGLAPTSIEIALPCAHFAHAQNFNTTGCGFVCEVSGDDPLPPPSRLAQGEITRFLLTPSLIARLGRDKNVDTIIRLVVNLASTAGVEVVACGVATLNTRDRLAALGCHLQQGVLFGPPKCSAEFVAQVRGAA